MRKQRGALRRLAPPSPTPPLALTPRTTKLPSWLGEEQKTRGSSEDSATVSSSTFMSTLARLALGAKSGLGPGKESSRRVWGAYPNPDTTQSTLREAAHAQTDTGCCLVVQPAGATWWSARQGWQVPRVCPRSRPSSCTCSARCGSRVTRPSCCSALAAVRSSIGSPGLSALPTTLSARSYGAHGGAAVADGTVDGARRWVRSSRCLLPSFQRSSFCHHHGCKV